MVVVARIVPWSCKVPVPSSTPAPYSSLMQFFKSSRCKFDRVLGYLWISRAPVPYMLVSMFYVCACASLSTRHVMPNLRPNTCLVSGPTSSVPEALSIVRPRNRPSKRGIEKHLGNPNGEQPKHQMSITVRGQPNKQRLRRMRVEDTAGRCVNSLSCAVAVESPLRRVRGGKGFIGFTAQHISRGGCC